MVDLKGFISQGAVHLSKRVAGCNPSEEYVQVKLDHIPRFSEQKSNIMFEPPPPGNIRHPSNITKTGGLSPYQTGQTIIETTKFSDDLKQKNQL